MTTHTPRSPGPVRAALPFAAALLSVSVGLGFLVHVPYLSIGPGPAYNMLDQITSQTGGTNRSDGKLLLMTVSQSVGTLTVWETMWRWALDDGSLVPIGSLRQGCATDEEERANEIAEIEGSKLHAEVAAFRALKLPPERIDAGRVLKVFEKSPSDGKLRDGDLIVAVDGRPTPSALAVSVAITKREIRGDDVVYHRKPGETVRMTVARGSRRVNVTIRTRASGGCEPDRPAVGIALGGAYTFARTLNIDTEDVGGPSGGLVFALSIVDAFTTADLTRGHVVAVTGTLDFVRRTPEGLEYCDPEGAGCFLRVGEIGGIREKVGAAVNVGASIFIVPATQLDEAREWAPDSLKVYGAGNLTQALSVLRTLPPKTGKAT